MPKVRERRNGGKGREKMEGQSDINPFKLKIY